MHSLYNRGEDVEITRVPGDSYLVIDSADRSSSTTSTGEALTVPSTQPYNNFRLQKPQNLVQGGFTRLQLTEINFPYAIPNINPYTNSMWVKIRNPSTGVLIYQQVILNSGSSPVEGMYYGNTLAALLSTNLNNIATISTDLGISWQVIYIPSDIAASYNGGFQIIATLVSDSSVYPYALFPYNPNLVGVQPIPAKSLLSVLGFNVLSNWDYITTISLDSPFKVSSYAPLSYTSYIDVCSSKLTYYQNVQDSSSKTNSRGGMICRIYISDETSTSPSIGYFYNGTTAVRYQATLPPGSAPFVIHRQFDSPKSFKWNKNTAIDWVDIQLYDDVGQPLYISPNRSYPDFQITFKCTED